MAESSVVKVKRDGAITLKDGAGTPKTYTISAEPGDFSLAVPLETRNDFLDRGRLVGSVRFGDDQPVTGSFSAYFRGGLSTDGAAATLTQICDGTIAGVGTAAWVSTLGADAEVFAVDVVLTVEGTDHGDATDHTVTIPDCSLDFTIAEGDPNVITVNFRSHTAVRPTFA
jgi:hypothetical protein